jgi:hypothetical protein
VIMKVSYGVPIGTRSERRKRTRCFSASVVDRVETHGYSITSKTSAPANCGEHVVELCVFRQFLPEFL